MDNTPAIEQLKALLSQDPSTISSKERQFTYYVGGKTYLGTLSEDQETVRTMLPNGRTLFPKFPVKNLLHILLTHN